MTRLRAFLGRLRGKRRPPTGPLTTDEEHEAEALRQSARPDPQRIEQEADETTAGTA
jgi:hypothetical protein